MGADRDQAGAGHMSRFWPLYALLAAAWAVILFTYAAPSRAQALGDHAAGHDWYQEQRDPQFSQSNCCRNDCAEVDPEWVTMVPGGYRLTMTAEQASRVA